MGRYTTLTTGVLAVLHASSFLACAVPLSGYGDAPPASTVATANIPQYVLDYAPVVYLHSQDPYFPSDLAAHVSHTKPETDSFQDVTGAPNPLTLDNLDSLNSANKVWLTSKDDISANPFPAWLTGTAPDASGKTNGAKSAVVVVTDKGNGDVDAFYMYFYSYNQGGSIFGSEVDNHVGDWEHNMIRFKNGVPQALWYSQHSSGQAFKYAAVEKQGQRPICYSAIGSHANYATAGLHQRVLIDRTDRGKLWDPLLSAYTYAFNAADGSFTPAAGDNPLGLVRFTGNWGDKEYPDSDSRQHKFLGIEQTAKYANGPTGPIDKQLNRSNVCPGTDLCLVLDILLPRDVEEKAA